MICLFFYDITMHWANPENLKSGHCRKFCAFLPPASQWSSCLMSANGDMMYANFRLIVKSDIILPFQYLLFPLLLLFPPV